MKCTRIISTEFEAHLVGEEWDIESQTPRAEDEGVGEDAVKVLLGHRDKARY